MTLLGERGRLSVTGAADELDVSLATIRRDFTALDEQQLVNRTHGGVVAAQVAYELPVRYRMTPDDPRDRIGAALAQRIGPGDVVGLNGGTTTSAVARHIGALSDSFDRRVTVVTNAVNIAAELVLRDQIVTISTGGVAKPHSYELTGPIAHRSLDDMWLGWMVLGVGGLSLEGASCSNHDEAEVNAAMVQRATRVVVVAAAEKLGNRSFSRICALEAVDELITDQSAPMPAVEALRTAGVEVTLV